MAYTFAWNPNAPAGTDPVQIPTDITSFKKALQERLAPAIFTDFTLDPLVLADQVSGKVTGLVLFIPGFRFQPNDSSKTFDLRMTSDHALETNAPYLAMDVPVPRGVTITEFGVVVWTVNPGASTANLLHLPNAAGIPTWTLAATLAIPSDSNASGTFRKISSTGLSIVTTSEYWQMTITNGNATHAWMGAYFVYDRPSHLVG